MTLDIKVDTSVNLSSQYSDSSINDSVFFASSESIDVINLIFVVVTLFIVFLLHFRLGKRISTLESEVTIIFRFMRTRNLEEEVSVCVSKCD